MGKVLIVPGHPVSAAGGTGAADGGGGRAGSDQGSHLTEGV